MTWTTKKPTKPGPYWFSCEPSKRGPACIAVDAVMLIQEPGKDGLTVSMAGLYAPLSMDWFNGAQWKPRETTTDPFATTDADRHAHEGGNTGEPCASCGVRQPRADIRWSADRSEIYIGLSMRLPRAKAKKEITGLCSLLKVCSP